MHMAFLSRGFKNLQWYSMTTKTPETPVFREFFHVRKQVLALFLALCGVPCPLKPLKKEGGGSFRPPPAVLVLFYADNSSVRVV